MRDDVEGPGFSTLMAGGVTELLRRVFLAAPHPAAATFSPYDGEKGQASGPPLPRKRLSAEPRRES
ncbi:hypothetical protein JT737_18000, partial [Sinorhizobium meliloti]|nr:hypothetical protein [Sinorhizobium meliloti]